MIGTSLLEGPDGEELILLFDHAARLTSEDAADAPFSKLNDQGFEGRLGYLGALLYGGLRRHHPKLTLAEAHGLVETAANLNLLLALQEGMIKALTASMPAIRGDDEENPPKAPGGTGTPSSAPGAKKASSRKPSGGRRPAASR